MDTKDEAKAKVANEVLSILLRYSSESDLDDIDLAEASMIGINTFLQEETLVFESDPQMLKEEEQEDGGDV